MSLAIEDLLHLINPELAEAAGMPEAKERVIAALASLGLHDATKRFLYARWARTLDIRVEPADLERVAPSSTAPPAPPKP